MSAEPIAVLKLGSSVLRDEADLPRAVSEIYRWMRDGHRVVAVVSAFGGTTDGLLAAARSIADPPAAEPLATLLATGETRSAALLTLALDRAGIPARLLDPVRLRLTLRGPRLDGAPVAIDRFRLRAALRAAPVAVLPGFFGLAEGGGLGLLGRGGSDLTALFVADALNAEICRLLKDVAGVYVRDPRAEAIPKPERYRTLSFETALRVARGSDSRVLQGKAVEFAARAGRGFEVSAAADARGTRIGRFPDVLESPLGARPPLRVGLLGLGTVGSGVHAQLDCWPERFQVVGIGVRDPSRARAAKVDARLLHADPRHVLELRPDVIVETMGGLEPAERILVEALRRGCHVVTANKMVVAAEGERLADLAARNGVELRFAAAVGGGVPVLEAVRHASRAGPLKEVSGVLNGTCNFVLDRLAEGVTRADAVRSAQLRGLAEADPSDDLRGFDSARKLVLVAREAFGVWLRPAEIRCRGIQELDAQMVRQAAADGRSIRLVASCVWTPRGVQATVAPRRLSATHPFAQCRDEDNVVRIVPVRGTARLLFGKGAGRWPTSESVLADLLDLSRQVSPRQASQPEAVPAGVAPASVAESGQTSDVPARRDDERTPDEARHPAA